MKVALFDCDGTLTKAQFGRGLIKYAEANGLKYKLRRFYAAIFVPYFANRIGLYPEEKFLRYVVSRLSILLKNMTLDEADEVYEWNVHHYLLPTLREDIADIFRNHNQAGDKTILVSAQYQPNLDKIASALGASAAIGTKVRLINSRYAIGRGALVIAGKDKELQVRNLITEEGWEVDWENSYAYGDSITDRQLFEMVGNPVAVHPDEKLLSHARKHNWQIIK